MLLGEEIPKQDVPVLKVKTETIKNSDGTQSVRIELPQLALKKALQERLLKRKEEVADG